MTLTDVREIIESDVDPDDETLVAMFVAVYGRKPGQDDWDAHLYSLICAGAVEEE